MKIRICTFLHFPYNPLDAISPKHIDPPKAKVYLLSFFKIYFLIFSLMPFFKDFSVMNASGPHCTTLEELEAIGASEADCIVTKSCSLEPRE